MSGSTCHCVEEIKYELYESAIFQKEIVSTAFKNTCTESKKEAPKQCSDIEVKLKGGQHITVSFKHIYCPFCGIEINRGA